ncbi:MAG: SRPBCC family protein [bacterium]|nr:SRPBCC family protein [bacterium]
MKVINIHERRVRTKRDLAAEVFESLATKRDRLWPRRKWPAIRLDASKAEHGRGGHGPIRYRVTEHRPGEKTIFEFEDAGLSRGLEGRHYFELVQHDAEEFTARHVIEARLSGAALLFWPLVIRPLHDALVEDALDNFERATTESVARENRYSPYVKLLRAAIVR